MPKLKVKLAPPDRVSDLQADDTEGKLYDYPWLYFRRIEVMLGEPNGWILRPLGGWNYGYREDYQVYSSWTIWALTMWGAISHDYIEGIGLLAGAMYLNEHEWARSALIHNEDGVTVLGSGASWVHNVMAGYCWYHYYIKGKNSIPLRLGSWAELAGNLGAVIQETIQGVRLYSHEAHYKGAAEGMTVAWALDMLRGKRGGGWGEWWKPFAAIGILIAADYTGSSEIKNATKQR